MLYEAITTYLCFARLLLHVIHENDDDSTLVLYQQTVEERLIPLCRLFHDELKQGWERNSKTLFWLIAEKSPFGLIHYLIWCARVLEIDSLLLFLTKEETEKEEIISFLTEFIQKEVGCGHVLGDRYVTSLVWTLLALIQYGKTSVATDLIKRSAVWLCDRTEKGFGLAEYEDDEYQETAILLGYPFDFIKAEKNRSSFLATALCDLAAFIGDDALYGDLVNDFEACEIVYTHWRFPDTAAIFTVTTDECIVYPNVPHRESIGTYEALTYAAHLAHEPSSFQIVNKAGMNSLILLSMLLKDRYIPRMWKHIMADKEPEAANA